MASSQYLGVGAGLAATGRAQEGAHTILARDKGTPLHLEEIRRMLRKGHREKGSQT